MDNVGEYNQIRQDIRDLRGYIDNKFTQMDSRFLQFVPYTEYNARHVDIEKELAEFKGAYDNHVKEGYRYMQAQQQSKAQATWTVVGYIIIMVTSGGFVELINWLFKR